LEREPGDAYLPPITENHWRLDACFLSGGIAARRRCVMLETVELSDRERKLGEFGYAGDDHVVPFEVGPLDARGRIVQLGPLLDAILERHDYPESVARLLAEACVVATLLGSSLKFDGKFILQTRTDGPVDMLVADFTTPGSL